MLFYCHAGCHLDAILAALNLTPGDLFEPRATAAPPPVDPQLSATYDYTDETGRLLYQVLRYHPKTFRQRHPDGQGGWLNNLNGVRRVLYRLHELKGHARVIVVEGEKDANRLWEAGLPATTNSGGSKGWREDFPKQLLQAGVQRVIAIPDNDQPGRDHAAEVVRTCLLAGIKAATVALPGLLEHGDVSDWLEVHQAAELLELLEGAEAARKPLAKLVPLRLAMSEPVVEQRWLVDDRIGEGTICLLAAKPKVGKTTAARCLAAAVAGGSSWLGFECQIGTVWYLAFEGRRQDHLSHFRQLGLTDEQLERIFIYTERPDTEMMAQLMERAEAERPALIIVDTLQGLIQAESMEDYAEIARRMEPVIDLARRANSALLLIHHAKKTQMDSNGGDSIDAVLGSTAIAGSVDNVFVYENAGPFRTLRTIQRIGESLEPRVVRLTEVGQIALGESKEEATRTALAKKILEQLQGASDWMTIAEICDLVNARKQLVIRALNQLTVEKILERKGNGQRQHPWRYQLVTMAAPSSAPVETQPTLVPVEEDDVESFG